MVCKSSMKELTSFSHIGICKESNNSAPKSLLKMHILILSILAQIRHQLVEVELREKRVKKANPGHHVNRYNFLNLSSMSHGYQIKLLENVKILSHFLS